MLLAPDMDPPRFILLKFKDLCFGGKNGSNLTEFLHIWPKPIKYVLKTLEVKWRLLLVYVGYHCCQISFNFSKKSISKYLVLIVRNAFMCFGF